jgi:hypothetical protein
MDSTCNNYSADINGKISSIVETEVLVDGVDIEIDGVAALAVDEITNNASTININDIVKITGKLSRLHNKVKFLENRI